MRQNSQRRISLLDAAIQLLSQEGSGGLSYRTLEARAGVPAGTASNYFRNRTELLVQVTRRIHERLQPDAEFAEAIKKVAGEKQVMAASLENLLGRVRRDRDAYMALLEVRLLAQRQPEIRSALLPIIRENMSASQISTPSQPGRDFLLIYLAMSGLLFEELTLPEVLAPHSSDLIVSALLEKIS